MFVNEKDNEELDNNSRRLYPDFYKEDFIIDAKYKHLENGVGREDLYQVVTYMFCKKAENGAYIYPCKDENIISIKHKLSGYGGNIFIVPFFIPQSSENYNCFRDEIFESENGLSSL